MQAKYFPVVVCVVILFSIPSFAQNPANLPTNANSTDAVANEIALLRKSLQTLNARLLEIANKALAGDANQSGSANKIAFHKT